MYSGKYAYRFNGVAMQLGNQFHLVGVGVMDIDAQGKITGFHTSTNTLLDGNSYLTVSRFTLTGTFGPRKDGFGADDLEADIEFVSVDKDASGNPRQVLRGTFSAVPNKASKGKGIWLISTGAFNETTQSKADEVVSGEANKIA